MQLYSRVHPTDEKESAVWTAHHVSKMLYDIIRSEYEFESVFDPCIGAGNLIWPWREEAMICGMDVGLRPACADWFRKGDFLSVTRFNVQPDLVLCNPPFNGGDRRMMFPERFARKIFEIFGGDIPLALVVPVGFRHNIRTNSRRRLWLQNDAPPITSIVSLPIDAFLGVTVCSEILIFNLKRLSAHYI